jgi:beta-N-acetylhexosaminidase
MHKSCRGKGLPGTAISWEKHAIDGSKAFVVEFGPGKLKAGAARRNARAAVAVTRGGAGGATAEAIAAGSPRPNIRKWLIPFPKHRKSEMAAYSKRHYGKSEWRLRYPKVIVEHISVTDTTREVYNTFAPDRPDVEFHELPGVCSHFVVSPKGRIYKLVPVSIRCRHTVGLNHVAIGIEHVGHRDQDVLNNSKMFRHSVKLTQYLRCRFGIRIKNVIGHNESLSSPFYRELDPDFRGQTHADWSHDHMRIYRNKLRKRGPC